MNKVLVVDDAAFARRQTRSILERVGFNVVEATNGEDAITLFDSFAPDIALMDLTMPRMGGLEAIKAIRVKHPNAKVIVITVVDQLDVLRKARDAGALDVIIKPYNEDRLLRSIRDGLRTTRPA